jgi:hypothetical protein
VAGGKVILLGGHSIGHSKQNLHMCPSPNGFWDIAISLYSSNIDDKKEILRTISNTCTYCSSDQICTVYLVLYIFEYPTINLNALCNSREDMARCSSECMRAITSMALSWKMFGIGHTLLSSRVSESTTSQNTDLSSWDILYTRQEA